MDMFSQEKIRNLAIIAHVDHGKTTLVDGLLKQAKVFRDNAHEMTQTTLLDNRDLERERGITILAKSTAIVYNGYLINITDTPGHADFSGEVERVLNMADGAILVVDSQEGPKPQTRFVLKKALDLNLKIIVFINKLDKKDVRIAEVERLIENLFVDLASEHHHLEYSLLYGISREGRCWESFPEPASKPADLKPLFKKIITDIPAPKGNAALPFKMLVSSLDYDSFRGKYALGRIRQGEVKLGEDLLIRDKTGKNIKFCVTKVQINLGLKKIDLERAGVGEIILISGSTEFNIGDTLTHPADESLLEGITIGEPTLKLLIGANTSPFSGKEGRFSTSRQLKERIFKELETNVGLKVKESASSSTFVLFGRGELNLSVFIETLRREGYEFQVGRPEVVTKEVDGKVLEPYEKLYIDISEEYSGVINRELGKRRATLLSLDISDNGVAHLVFKITTRATLGLRSVLLSVSHGTAVVDSDFIGYEPAGDVLPKFRNGVLIASESGKAVTYGLNVAQGRGSTFIDPSADVYQGMIVGLNCRDEDIEINVCKEKKQSNVRSSTSDIAVRLAPKVEMSLEQCLSFLEADELLEVTPKSLRLRKKLLDKISRVRASRAQ